MVDYDAGLQTLNLVMTLVPFILSSAVVGVRICRKISKRNFAPDNLLLAVAQILAIGLTVATCIFIKVSYTGYHPEKIPTGVLNKTEASKWRFINAVLYNPILALIKVSFIMTLINLQAPSVLIRASLWTLFAVNVMFGIAGTLVALLDCRPIPRFWDRTIPGSCMNTAHYIYGTISVTIITDAMVSIIPIFVLFGLQMPRKTKILIVSFLSLGLVVTAIASYRLSVFVRVFSMANPLQNESTYNVRTPLSNIEASLAAVAACGPTLKYLLRLVIPVFSSSRSKTRSETPQWTMVTPNQPMSRFHEANETATHWVNNTKRTSIEMSGVPERPKKTADGAGEGNGSIRTATSTLADRSIKASCEKPRFLV